jgi:molybdopterin/thiamine biosynthesis adenylyltransferase
LDVPELERYARHLQLAEIGPDGQDALCAAKVFVVGAGGLGSPVLMYLAAAGIGEITICDFDRVELSNLQRQIVHTSTSIGADKVDSAALTIARLNPRVNVRTIGWAIDGEDLTGEVQRADVVVDASDNFETRFALNRACVQTRTPLVSGAAIRFEGQIFVVDPSKPGTPCYRCLYEEAGDPDEPCALVGVLSPLLGIIGSVQAMEAMKIILGLDGTLVGRLIRFDALTASWRESTVRQDPSCPVCCAASARP